MAALISKGFATMRELEEYYSLEDAYTMAEIIKVNSYNEWQSYKNTYKSG